MVSCAVNTPMTALYGFPSVFYDVFAMLGADTDVFHGLKVPTISAASVKPMVKRKPRWVQHRGLTVYADHG